jgi:hypothetical protein
VGYLKGAKSYTYASAFPSYNLKVTGSNPVPSTKQPHARPDLSQGGDRSQRHGPIDQSIGPALRRFAEQNAPWNETTESNWQANFECNPI